MHYDYAQRFPAYQYKLAAISVLQTMDRFPLFYPGYPSTILGVSECELSEQDMGQHLLGFTNGKTIVRRKNLGLLKDFVQFHEEEHVKDMSANELETDTRAFRRLLSLKNHEKTDQTLELLAKRWGNEVAELVFHHDHAHVTRSHADLL